MADLFSSFTDSVNAPARRVFAVIPNDTTELAIMPKAIMAGADGVITLRAADDAADIDITVIAGVIYPIRARFIRATGTTATSIRGLA